MIRMEIWGERALFSRPEFKVERVTYDVITPSAARGILTALYWHPGMAWHVDRIYVLNPFSYTSIRRNEVKSVALASLIQRAMNGKEQPLMVNASSPSERSQRASMLLRDVHYVIEAHFSMTKKAAPTDSPEKFQSIIRRRLKKGQCYYEPYFGCREFPVSFQEWAGGDIQTTYPDEIIDLGHMLYDLDYSVPGRIRPLFFHAVLENGVLDLTKRRGGEPAGSVRGECAHGAPVAV